MKAVFSFLLIALLFAQCTAPKMALNNNEWQSKQEYNVEGRNKGLFKKQKLVFGEYSTTSVKRSWTKGTEARTGWSIGNPTDANYENILSIVHSRRKQTLNFAMANDKGDSSEVFCLTKVNSNTLQVGKNPNSIVNIATDILTHSQTSSNTFYVRAYTNKSKQAWELMLDNDAWVGQPKSYVGIFAKDKDNYYTLVPVTKMLGKNGEPASILFGAVGLEIRNKQGKPVAAVSLLDKGMVYLSDIPAEERFLLANLCAALLMQEHIDS